MWNINTAQLINTLKYSKSVSNLSYKNNILITYVDFDNSYIFSSSYDTTVKVWDFSNFSLIRTINVHRRILCMQLINQIIISGHVNGERSALKINAKAALGRIFK